MYQISDFNFWKTYFEQNQTDYGNMKYQTDAGKFGEGFVWYLHGNMTRDKALEIANKIEEAQMFDNDMKVTCIEFMFYSNNNKLGIINSYYFFRSNVGVNLQI